MTRSGLMWLGWGAGILLLTILFVRAIQSPSSSREAKGEAGPISASPAVSPAQRPEDPILAALKQTIIGSGNDCQRVSGYMRNGPARTVTCQNGGAGVAYDVTESNGTTTVQKVERRRN